MDPHPGALKWQPYAYTLLLVMLNQHDLFTDEQRFVYGYAGSDLCVGWLIVNFGIWQPLV